jgi:alkanesulfonate monooxygenase SsuD/methylene tetrahydromethanopterin reductase-like flavin-dependent oxidoreductase (luciferase family)
MSIRAGVQFGGWPLGPIEGGRFLDFVDRVEDLGFDSLWFSDRLISTAPTLGPIAALAAVAARTSRLKFGSAGRMLPAFGLGTEDEREYEAAGVLKSERAGRTDEAVNILRRLWTEDHVSHRGRYYRLSDVTITPKPVQRPSPPIWFGGRSEAAFRRTGRLGDGWLASSITPEEVRRGIESIRRAAADAGRSIDPDHFGAIISFKIGPSGQQTREALVPGLTRLRPDAPLEDYCALGSPDDCIAVIRRYIEAGASKFVMRPACHPHEIDRQIELLAREVLPAVEATPV